MNEVRDKDYGKVHIHQEKMKNTFDRNVKEEKILVEYLVLKWDAPHEEKVKHGKFHHMWFGTYIIATYRGENAFILQHHDGSLLEGGLVNGRFLKNYLTRRDEVKFYIIVWYSSK